MKNRIVKVMMITSVFLLEPLFSVLCESAPPTTVVPVFPPAEGILSSGIISARTNQNRTPIINPIINPMASQNLLPL